MEQHLIYFPILKVLIKPAAGWDEDAWDPNAEALHGVSRVELLNAGAAPETVCAALNNALGGRRVYSDAPDWDGFWLYRLFQAAKVRQAFELSDFHDLFADFTPDAFHSLAAKAAVTAPHCHRATEDVLHMKTLYGLAAARVD